MGKVWLMDDSECFCCWLSCTAEYLAPGKLRLIGGEMYFSIVMGDVSYDWSYVRDTNIPRKGCT